MTAAPLATAGSTNRAGVAGLVRLRPAPPLEPPFDDEIDTVAGAGGPAIYGQLALDWNRERPAIPGGPGRAARSAVSRGAPGRGEGGSAAPLTRPPENRMAARRFLGVGLEILNGYRPPGQLRPFCAPADAGTVIEQFAGRAARPGRGRPVGAAPRPDGARTVAGRWGAGAPRRTAGRVLLRRLWVGQPRPEIAEVTAVLDAGDRCWALAFRLEYRRGTWLCTAVAMP